MLADPGASDLSAHVDFAALGDAGRRGGAAVFGPVDQGEFLDLSGHRRARRAAEPQANPQDDGDRCNVDRLIDADQMGTLFKALAIVPKSAPTPPGF